MAATMSIHKGDLVQVISGKDRGKQGRVLEALPRERRVIVASRMGQTQIQPGGIVDIAAPLDVSNVMVVCPVCNRATRIGHEFREQKGRQVKVRVCKRADCREVLDR